MASTIFCMPPSQPLTTQENVTPREFFEVISFGIGRDFNRRTCVEYLKEKNERGREVIEQTRQIIEEITGLTPEQLTKLSSDKDDF